MLPEKPMRPVFLAAAVFAVTMALMPQPPKVYFDRFGDKFEHMLAFAALALLARLGWRRASPWRILERLSFFGALIEVFQSIPSLHRDCDPKDWIADTIAAGAVLAVATMLQRHAPAQRGEEQGHGQ